MSLDELIPVVKAALAKEAFSPLVDTKDADKLQKVQTFEPVEAKTTPLLTMMFAGFKRAGLETPMVQPPIQDPLGGRRWVLNFDVRIWVDLVSDEQAAQERMDALVPTVVAALEANRSLGGVSVDAAIASGDINIMSPKQGQALLICTCKCAVEVEEALT